MLGEEIYSEDLILQSQLEAEEPHRQISEIEGKEKVFNKLFIEETFRKKILKKIFKKDESFFKEFVYSLIDENSWEDATKKIDEMFSNRNVNYYTDEAVRFVDIMQNHFTGSQTTSDDDNNIINN